MTVRPLSKGRRAAAALLLGLGLGAAPLAASAVDLSWSGFATLGYAKTVSAPGTYLRWIDEDGTFNAGSLVAGQLDMRLTPQWSATLQVRAAPSESVDSQWDLRPAWAFVAWRASDEWLLRGGRMRVPLYLNSESLDVGVAYEMARLPVEMYSIAPSNEYDGVSIGYSRPTTLLEDGDLSVELYGGRFDTKARFWLRDGLPPQLPAGDNAYGVDVRLLGINAVLRSPRSTLRLSVIEGRPRSDTGDAPVSYPFVPIAPGLGYYKVNDEQPGPPIPTVSRLRNVIVTLGVEHAFGDGWRVAGEFARGRQFRTEVGSNTLGGYVALFKELGSVTPYASYGRLKTSATQMDSYRRLTQTVLPPFIPGADQLNAAQRIAAETIYVANQSTFALGAAWQTPVGGRLKLEYGHTRIGEVSRLVDARPGQPTPRDQSFGTWTVNYSLAF